MDRLSLQEWDVLSVEEQKTREAEMPWVLVHEKSKAEQERLVNLNIEKDRKLKAALAQVEELDKRIKALETSGAPQSQIQSLEQLRANYMKEYEQDPMMANARLASQGIQFALSEQRKIDTIKKQTLRKIRKEYPKDYDKYGDELEDKLDLVTGPITLEDIIAMFNSLRGKSIDEQLKEAEQRGAKKALEEAGIVAVDEGAGSGGGGSPTSLTKDQQAEMQQMGLNEKDYKELLHNRQEEDKSKSRTPRTLINPKP